MSEVILYVDDDEANLVVFEAAFGDDFKVVTATSGAEGLELLRKHEVAVLLVDQRMPGMTGVEMLEEAHAINPDPVRVLITAYSDLADTIAAINRGRVERYARKPWEPIELRGLLVDAIDVYRLRRKVDLLQRRLAETERVYALGVVAASVAHELRNPLGAAMPSLELARGQLAELKAQASPDKAAALGKILEHLELAATGLRSMREIVRGMELSNRRQEGNRSTNLAEAVRLTLRMLRSQALNRAQILVEDRGVPEVEGTATEIGQVLLNLLVNAIQAMPDRHYLSNEILVRMSRGSPGEVVLEVRDNGTGISPEALGKIFDPFFSTRGQGGTGLGLAISRKIVEANGGRIEVESQLGEGTRFIVSLREAGARHTTPALFKQ